MYIIIQVRGNLQGCWGTGETVVSRVSSLSIVVVIVLSLSGCIQTTEDNTHGGNSIVASIGNFKFGLNSTEIQNVSYDAVKIELESLGYAVGTHLNNSALQFPYLHGEDYYLVALRYSDTNFTYRGILAIEVWYEEDIDLNFSTGAEVYFTPSEKYYYNQTNVTKDTAYLRLKAKEVFQVCNITADVDKWELKVNYIS